MNFSEISPTDAQNSAGGNRLDVPGGGVLYAASTAEGAYAETLARFRPTAAMRALPRESDEHFMEVGAVPADWRTRRELVRFALEDPLPFIDVDAPATHAFLTQEVPGNLAALGYDTLDVAAVRGRDRFLTRFVAGWAFAQTDSEGRFLYSGIRYGSRLGDYECWAIFQGAQIVNEQPSAIDRDDRHLALVARDFDLTIH